MVSLEQVTYLTGISTDRVKRIVEFRQEPIRAIVKTGNSLELIRQESNIINALHAIAEIYTSADFSKLTEEDAKFTLNEMKNFVVEHYSMLSINELREAFSLAASGKIKADLRAWNGKFTISMIGDVLSAYLSFSNNLIYQYDKQNTLLLSRNKEAENKAKNEQARQEVIQAYLELKEQYKEDLEIDEKKIFFHWGKILVEAGYINFEKDEKLEIYKEAETLVKKDLNKELADNQQPTKKRELRKLIEIINSKDQENPKNFKNKVHAKYSILIVKKSIIDSI